MTFAPPEVVRTMSQPDKFGSPSVFTSERLEILKERIAANSLTSRQLARWNEILATDNTYEPLGALEPFYVPSFGSDPVGHNNAVRPANQDGMAAVDLALRYAVFGNEFDAAAVARILTAWLPLTVFSQADDSRLVWSTRWPMFIQAATLIKNSPSYTESLDVGVKALTERGMVNSGSIFQTENRAVWGCVLDVSAGSFLNNRAYFDRGIRRWRELFSNDVRDNVPSEIRREADGLHYCNFLLAAMVQTAEIARFNGEWLYDYKTLEGSTLLGVWENVRGWTLHPETYPYWEVAPQVRIMFHVEPLNALYPSSESEELMINYSHTNDFFGYRNGLLAYLEDVPLW